MTLSRQLDITVQEMLPLPLGSCKACERTGIPVLLLREAPNSQDAGPEQARRIDPSRPATDAARAA